MVEDEILSVKRAAQLTVQFAKEKKTDAFYVNSYETKGLRILRRNIIY